MPLNLKTDVPLLLLPVKIETRFTDNGNELLIRVYPDAVHLDSFDPRLTEAEAQRGRHFWQQTWSARSRAQERNAWAQLAQVFGPQRAAWIAQQLTPTNPGDRLANKSPEFRPPPPVDPESPYIPCVRLLPDQWVAVFYSRNQQGELIERFRQESRPVRDALPAVPTYESTTTIDDLVSEPDSSWLQNPDNSWIRNFKKAEAVGMGIRVPHPPERIDLLLVYGVKGTTAPELGPIEEVSRKQLVEVLRAHHHTDGLAFVSQGTTTNNTTTASSGYSSADPGSVNSFDVEREQKGAEAPMTNCAILASAFGIDQRELANLQGANGEAQRDASNMNKVFWQKTWGYFLEEMLLLKDTHHDDIGKMREHFEKYVRARGPLPTLRIGQQPYGVLPVLSLGESGGTSVEQGLRALRKIWRACLGTKNELGDENVPRLLPPEQRPASYDPSLTLLQVLAMAPTAISYVGRPCTSVVASSSPTSPEGLARSGTPLPTDLQDALDALLGPNTLTPHQRTVFASQSNVFPVANPLVLEDTPQGPSSVSLFNLLRDQTQDSSDLARLSVAERELLLKETLDLCSHRLDAWITSLATERLEQLRDKKPTGITIGGYGWIENLKKAGNEAANQGFIHAPSLAHATTAAVLRSGYESRRLSQTPTDSNALAINLSSERVRLALHLIDGVRGGQSLGSLLGYRFERGLHERRLDKFIPAFRTIAPGSAELVSKDEPHALTDAEKAKLKELLLDGLKLQEVSIDWTSEDLRKATTEEKAELQRELSRLAEAVDAVADLALAESVHHAIRGDHARAGATLEAITRGEAPPPAELEFIRTPRTGMNHTHRICVIFGAPPATFPWGTSTPRAQAEPTLNAWAAQLLGPRAEEAACIVTYTDSSGAHTLPVSIQLLGLAPLDLVYLLEGELGGNDSEIEQRIVSHVLVTAPSAKNIAIEFASSTAGTPRPLAEVLEVARSIRRVMTRARACEPRDVALPEQGAADATVPVDQALVARATAGRTAFIKATTILGDLLPENLEAPLTNPQAVPEALRRLAAYGLLGAIPSNPNENSHVALKSLHAQARAVLSEAQARRKRAEAVPTPIQTTAQALSVFKAVFGEDFRVLPSFTPNNGKDLNQTFARSTAWQGGDPLASITWFQRIARVREGAARLDAAMLYAEALNGPFLNFQIGQLPYDETEQWVALDPPPGLALDNPPDGNRLSLACVTTGAIDYTKPVAGLMVDEWVEVIPKSEEVTGVAFHCNAPQSRAPHALLLAVAPEGLAKWDSATLERTLCETLELAKLRAVDLTALGGLGQYLPAMYFKHDSSGTSPFVRS